MEILIFGVAILAAALALVVYLRLANDLEERDRWHRFQQAMRDTQNPTKEP